MLGPQVATHPTATGNCGVRGLGPRVISRPTARPPKAAEQARPARAPGGTRTHTARCLRPRTLPIGLPGPGRMPLPGRERRGRRQSTALGTLMAVSQTPVRVVIAEDEALIRLDLKEML